MPTPPGLRRELEAIVGAERVLGRDIDLLGRSADASLYRLVPQAIVRPKDIGELRALFAWARAQQRRLTFRTAGTSLSGQAVTDDILIELGPFWRDNRVLDGGRRLWSQPGVVGGYLNRRLAPHGTRLGPDPASIDAAMLGGILANNSSGMCCGVAQNSYHTLDAMTLLLADGTLVDTARPDADERLRAEAPLVHAGLLRLRDEVRGDAPFAARIRRKFSRKTTTGYSLQAFLDHDLPAEILAHLMVGSEGTLGFIADATLRTVPDPPLRATAFAVFDDLVQAGAAVAPLAEAGAAALEILDAASLRSIREGLNWARRIEPRTAALLVEFRESDAETLTAAVEGAGRLLRHPGIASPEFSRDPRQRELWWRLRKGLFATTGAQRPSGSSFITEDVAVPRERLAEAIVDFQELFASTGFPETAVFGHAKDGNLHFNLSEDLGRPERVERLGVFMNALAELVAGKYDGALKAEHGSGRNMAPFVRLEWGEDGWELMWRIKRLLDPWGILNPGVVLNRDPGIHLKNLKPLPPISPLADACIECGFCEPHCPSRDLTLTPRQRIVVVRELARRAGRADRAVREDLEREFRYEGVATCVGDSLCQSACPVKIDTGALMKELKAAGRSPLARTLARGAATAFSATAAAARLALRLGRAAGFELPRAAPRLPRATARGRERRAVYFPSCLTRIVGEERELAPRAQVMIEVLQAAGFDVAYPDGIEGLCCGLAFDSKGFPEMGARLRDQALAAVRAATAGEGIALSDASPCALSLGVLDFPAFWARHGLTRVATQPLAARVALHPACSLVKAGGIEDLLRVARACAREALLPASVGCCGFAGDRGFFAPELTASATRDEAYAVRALEADVHCSTTRTCELAMTRATGRNYRSLVHLVRESLRV